MLNQSKVEVLQATYVNACAVKVLQKINQIFDERCCGCMFSRKEGDCLMLTEDEKLEMYFEEALSWLDPVKVEKSLQAYVDALVLGRKVRLFSSELCKDPRNDGVWKQRVRTNIHDVSS